MTTIRGLLILALLAPGCSGSDGPDPSALDGSSSSLDGSSSGHDGGAQQCTSGPCCDTASGAFKPATVECGGSAEELRCQSPQSCGSARQRREVKRYCSGASAACDGAVKRGAWEPTSACGATQRCSGPGTCASDTACGATGCTSGVCCDTSTGNFKPATVQCATTKEYSCVSSGCGAARQWRDAIRHCSGTGAACDGKTSYGQLSAASGCAPTEVCSGSGVCTASTSCTTTKPTVSVSPASGPRGTTFSEPGTGFTQNGQAKLFFKYPDGKVTTATKLADAKGSYTHSWTTGPSTPTGKYEYWAVDSSSGVKSNVVVFQITLSPQVTVTPQKGARGTTFAVSGSDLTAAGSVTLHFKEPGGKASQASAVADAKGTFAHSWSTGATTPTGTHEVYAVDDSSGAKSNTVQLEVTLNPKVSVTPAKGPVGTVFSEPGEGFTPNGAVSLFFQYPSGKVTSITETADAAGGYTHSWTTGPTTATGTYTYWAVDTTTGVKTDAVQFDVTP